MGEPDTTKDLSAEEKAAIKAEIEENFEDAVESEENGPDGSGNWPVTAEEVSIIRAELACEYPDDFKYFSDAYITSVASKPYSKDMTIRRPLEYSTEKLMGVMKWRAETGVTELLDRLKLANGPESAPEAVAQPEQLRLGKAMVTALNCGGCYFHGLTKSGKPVLWVRTNRLPWYPDVDALIKCLILLADTGISLMPKQTTDFVCVAETASPPPPHPTFLISLLKSLIRGYPDRLNNLVSAPTSSIMQVVMKLVLPLMPNRLANKFFFLGADEAVEKMKELLLNGEDDIPTFFGGKCDHDKYYPDEYESPNRGQGTLKFDYYGMVERLKEAKENFEATHKD